MDSLSVISILQKQNQTAITVSWQSLQTNTHLLVSRNTQSIVWLKAKSCFRKYCAQNTLFTAILGRSGEGFHHNRISQKIVQKKGLMPSILWQKYFCSTVTKTILKKIKRLKFPTYAQHPKIFDFKLRKFARRTHAVHPLQSPIVNPPTRQHADQIRMPKNSKMALFSDFHCNM